MFIELHILQSFAPSNLNRDDTGNPKDTEFGGVRRARISSQCIKRAIRTHPVFSKTTRVDSGYRSRWIARMFTERFMKAGKSEEEAKKASSTLAAYFAKPDKEHSSVLIHISPTEIEQLTNIALEKWQDFTGNEKKTEDALKPLMRQFENRTGAPDIALFGRMLAEKPELNIDAAVQVAHAISTHRVSMDIDFFTAVDDLITDAESGAGMMGVTGFNSACFYRYTRLDWDQLLKNLSNDTDLARRTAEGFMRASIAAVPTGKQNSFAAQNPPDLVIAVVRKDGESWSMANAFEKPIKATREGGYLEGSLRSLDEYWGALQAAYGSDGMNFAVLAIRGAETLNVLKPGLVQHREELIQSVMQALPEQ